MLASLLIGALIFTQAAMPTSSAPDVYVTNTLDGTVAVVNGTSVHTTIPVMDLRGVGTSPKETALSPNGSTLYTLSHANVPGKRFWITEINTRTAKYTGRAPIDFTPYQFVVTPDGKQAFVRNHARITAVNLQTGKPTYLRNLFPIDETLSPDGRTLYVAEDNGDLLAVNTATDAITTTLHNSNQDEAVAVSPDGKSVYVLSFSQVRVIDAATNTVTATIPLPQTSVHGGRYHQHLAVTPDGQRLFAYTAGAPTYSVVDLTNNSVLNTFTPQRGLRTLAFAPHGPLAYGTGSGIGYTIDTSTGAIDSTNTTAFTGGTHSIALTSDDTKAMVTEEPTNTVTEIDIATNTAAAKIEVGLEPYGVSVDPDGHAFVANEVSSTVSVVDVATATVINT
ncbi:MAG TPA: hypothetical protein VHZ97_23475, partial [Pseudonocardiaceae bacterium]|nr:hypothetical protein [Pseudonocardiaceae bacterium]